MIHGLDWRNMEPDKESASNNSDESGFIPLSALELKLSDSLHTSYSNMTYVAATNLDIRILFGRANTTTTREDSCIVGDVEVYMAPKTAFQLMHTLREKLIEYFVLCEKSGTPPQIPLPRLDDPGK